MSTPPPNYSNRTQQLAAKMDAALQLVTKWRTVFTGWQTGTRPKGDPEGDAIRDHRELCIIMRVEQTAMLALLVEKGVVTLDDWYRHMETEAIELEKLFQKRFPGIKATPHGLDMDIKAMQAAGTMAGWKP